MWRDFLSGNGGDFLGGKGSGILMSWWVKVWRSERSISARLSLRWCSRGHKGLHVRGSEDVLLEGRDVLYRSSFTGWKRSHEVTAYTLASVIRCFHETGFFML